MIAWRDQNLERVLNAARSARRQGSLTREVWGLAWPAITHMLLITLMYLAGRVMVGRYSGPALASLQISGTLVWSSYSLFTAFSAGTLAVVARSVGAGDRVAAARSARAAMLFSFLLGVAVVVPIRVANGALLRLLFPRADAIVIEQASAYLHIALPALPLAFVEAVAAASLQGAGDTKTPLYAATLGNIVNVVLSFVLIFGRFGAPELGVRGAAIGHAATMCIEGVALAAVLFSKRSPLPLRDLGGGAWDGLGRVTHVSWPAFAEKATYHTGFFLYIAILGLLGSSALAANQALIALEAICFLSADGFGVAAGAIVAQKLGAERPREAARAGLIAAGLSAGSLTLAGLVFAIAPRLLVSAFSSDPAIVGEGARALFVAAFAQPFMGFAMVIAMALRGAGATRTVLTSTAVSTLVVRNVATYALAITFGLGLTGVWLGSTADWVCRSLMLGATYLRGRWKQTRV